MDLATIAALRPDDSALLAFGVALLAALLPRAMGRQLPAGLAAGIGVLAGWWFAFGVLTASPRHLPERLPLLVLALLLAAPLLALPARRWPGLAWPAAALGALGAGWWMAGAPLVLPDLRRAAPELLGVGAATLALAGGLRWRWAAPVMAAALLAGLAAAAMPGPQRALAMVLLAAALGAALVPPRGGRAWPAVPTLLPLAAAAAALAALPVIARGTPTDWLAAAAPLLALLAGALLGARRGAPLGALLAGLGTALFAFLVR